MKNKKTWLVILAIALVFGMTAVGCDDDPPTGETDPYDNLPAAERWFYWTAPSTEATISLSVDDGDVATIIIGGTPEENLWERWKATVGYNYTGKKNTRYAYEFEAWTATGAGERSIVLQYYTDDSTSTYLQRDIPMTETRTTYTIYGQPLPNAENSFVFQCGNQLGTFYIKITSITEYTSGSIVLGEGQAWTDYFESPDNSDGIIFKSDGTFLDISNFSGSWVSDSSGTYSADNAGGLTITGEGYYSSYSINYYTVFGDALFLSRKSDPWVLELRKTNVGTVN